MSSRIRHGRIEVAANLHEFIDREVLPGLGFEAAVFWAELEKFLLDLAPRNRALLEKRDAIQARIDDWHRERKGKVFDAEAYRRFLTEIGYLVRARRGVRGRNRPCRSRNHRSGRTRNSSFRS